MITKLTPRERSLTKEILFCDALYITELKNPRIVPLFGPNGIGKSTVIKSLIDVSLLRTQMKIERTDVNMKVLQYRNSTDNAAVRKGRTYHESFDPRLLIDKMNAQGVSEGQSIIYSVFSLLDLISTGKYASYNEGGELLVVLDEIDSGLSIDNLDKVMRRLLYTSRRRKDVQVIFSFNNPYVVNYFPEVLSLYTGHPITLRGPQDMLDEIEKHKVEFCRKRYTRDGRPKIFD